MKKINIGVVLIVLLVAGFYFWQKQPNNTETKEDAIRQAQEYQPNGVCTDALVPAVHRATGAKYTFSNGCLAPGWEPER
jgi:hypothetical protein